MNEILKHEQNEFKKIMSEMGNLMQNLSSFIGNLYDVQGAFDEEGWDAEREEIDSIINILEDASNALGDTDDYLFQAADKFATLNRG